MLPRTALALGVSAITLLAPLGAVLSFHPSVLNVSGNRAAGLSSDSANPSNPFVNGMLASIVIGQANLTWNSYAGSPNASNIVPDPENPCMNSQGDLFVPNFGGSRVTEYVVSLTSDQSATIVLGQQNLHSSVAGTNQSTLHGPASCAVDSHGDLWVPDLYNNRVVEYVPPFHTGMNASLVLGQSNFNTSTAGTNQSGLDGPIAVTFDSSGDLWLAEAYNNRVLEFTPPFSTGMNASMVLGQSNFYSSAPGTSSTNLSYPDAVVYSRDVLWVSEFTNHRVVGFVAPFSSGEGATYVLGQSNFSVSNSVGPTAMRGPWGVSVDDRGDLWVSERSENRVLEYLPPFSSNESPAVVIGQSSLAGEDAGSGAANLSQPLGAWVGPTGTLWVADGGNDRVLGYVPELFPATFTSENLASGEPWSVTLAGSSQVGSTNGVTFWVENGTYGWNAKTSAGFSISPSSGSIAINGTGASQTLTFAQDVFPLEFEASGLPMWTGWSLDVAGIVYSSATSQPINVSEANGTYQYEVEAVAGYNESPQSGNVTVAGAAQEVGIGFVSEPAPAQPGAPSGTSSSTIALAAGMGGVGLVVGAAFGLLLGRRGRGGSSGPPPDDPVDARDDP